MAGFPETLIQQLSERLQTADCVSAGQPDFHDSRDSCVFPESRAGGRHRPDGPESNGSISSVQRFCCSERLGIMKDAGMAVQLMCERAALVRSWAVAMSG